MSGHTRSSFFAPTITTQSHRDYKFDAEWAQKEYFSFPFMVDPGRIYEPSDNGWFNSECLGQWFNGGLNWLAEIMGCMTGPARPCG